MPVDAMLLLSSLHLSVMDPLPPHESKSPRGDCPGLCLFPVPGCSTPKTWYIKVPPAPSFMAPKVSKRLKLTNYANV
ncbi:hypothetical protein PGT21_021149 [Puccinia graminis f. sp. tritici]|uniref:Secreted protein n=1 Tax=Puccinia graminis f. sp. tritici TaxID=56615 RepID=A0A5B0NLZ3_PUCGR|nr:hypothetical protein PGT21_021149 [Puccinia graminis f. sp. tritici]